MIIRGAAVVTAAPQVFLKKYDFFKKTILHIIQNIVQ